MATKTIDAKLLAKMFLAGAANLDAKKEWINELNVFPVPDGDTGTNMTLTILSAAKEVSALSTMTLKGLSKAISSGSLRGARGNSGVILSQLFRGFTKVIADYDTLDCCVLAQASQKAVETAYKAVMKPKEGTILTVARGVAEKAADLAASEEEIDVEMFLEEVIAYGDEVLAKTPDMLPVLKEAGVVDSGGQGLMQVLKGALDGLYGREIDMSAFQTAGTGTQTASAGPEGRSQGYASANLKETDIKFGYCTEFIIMLDKAFPEEEEVRFKAYLESIGDSIVCVAMDDIVKVHVHTNEPGNAIQKALGYGELTSMKIDNMRQEHRETLFKEAQTDAPARQSSTDDAESSSGTDVGGTDAETESSVSAGVPAVHKKYGFIVVSIGEGMNDIFRSLDVDCLIEGGQTMNPSTEDMLQAIEQVDADTIFILPNNKNIILAANQARDLTEDKEIIVIETTTVPQGIAALVAFSPDVDVEENKALMDEDISNVQTGQVTYAVRDTNVDGFDIKKDDYMGIGDGGILSVGKNTEQTAMDMDTAAAFSEKVAEQYADCDVELQCGGQPIYYYIVSVE